MVEEEVCAQLSYLPMKSWTDRWHVLQEVGVDFSWKEASEVVVFAQLRQVLLQLVGYKPG